MTMGTLISSIPGGDGRFHYELESVGLNRMGLRLVEHTGRGTWRCLLLAFRSRRSLRARAGRKLSGRDGSMEPMERPRHR